MTFCNYGKLFPFSPFLHLAGFIMFYSLLLYIWSLTLLSRSTSFYVFILNSQFLLSKYKTKIIIRPLPEMILASPHQKVAFHLYYLLYSSPPQEIWVWALNIPTKHKHTSRDWLKRFLFFVKLQLTSSHNIVHFKNP